MIVLKKFHFSYFFLFFTTLMFSPSFIRYENGLAITLIFLFLVNISCFATEFFVIKHYERNHQQNFSNRNEFLQNEKVRMGYAQFVGSQFTITLLLFLVFIWFI
ncbi:glucan phosphoethanolaminetransferase (alkaline phosphatase superfamily) [Alkalicoccobacillus murimartini]|uniref:Glucan phosphoethanolaminetransferase (Alkaline phosphatase superfamily) n=1 Tax=Alkalicoccobacillus murimartini TaxID=171685 RepID=A0ABT9YKM8_9BACI|nr:glucan phosphoethanolaminetransferase (alkaline phosphatase superfamily) [Alkalicoccobacillus murimartini]